jgi:hypothetical protein
MHVRTEPLFPLGKKISQTNNLAEGQNCFGRLFLMSCVSSLPKPKNCGQNNTLKRHVERVKCTPTLTSQIITRSITCRCSLTLFKPYIRPQQSVSFAQLKDTQIAGSGPINMLTEPFPYGTPIKRTAPFPRAFLTCLLGSPQYTTPYTETQSASKAIFDMSVAVPSQEAFPPGFPSRSSHTERQALHFQSLLEPVSQSHLSRFFRRGP